MKSHKLAKLLLKLPNKDVVILTGEDGDQTEIEGVQELSGSLNLQIDGFMPLDEDDERLKFIFNEKVALQRVEDKMEDKSEEDVEEIFQEYKVKSVEELMKVLKSDKKKLKRFAKDYLQMK